MLKFRLQLDKPRIRKIGRDWAIPFLRRAGAFVRLSAMRSMRKRTRISRPGEPPSAHTGKYKKSIVFHVDPRRLSVTIGPLAAKVGETLEFGGKAWHQDREQVVHYKPRPHMRPALEAGLRDLKQKSRDPLPPIWT